MIELVAAALLSCMVWDSTARVEAWLRLQGMRPVAVATSIRFERELTLWQAGDRYAIVVPKDDGACVLDRGYGWRSLS